jgi:hypothetical protein
MDKETAGQERWVKAMAAVMVKVTVKDGESEAA